MLSSVEAHQKGLEAGMQIALDQINQALGLQCQNLGFAIAEVTQLKRRYTYLKQDYEEIQQELKERADWK